MTVDRPGGAPVDPAFSAGLRDHLDAFRMAGVRPRDRGPPADVPLDIELVVCVEPDYFASEVKRRGARRALAAPVRLDGGRGFFHPDNFTFGQPVYLSQLVPRR